MRIYEYSDYKKALRETTEQIREKFGNRYTFEKMAHACGIQKTYLSRVLNGDSHLSADQVFTACEYLKLSEEETEFVGLLRELQTCSVAARKSRLTSKIEKIRSSHLKTENILHIKNELQLGDISWEYYSDVDIHLVHVLLSVPRFASNPEKICGALGLSQTRFEEILFKLRRWNLVEMTKNKIHTNEFVRHLREDSPVFSTFAVMQRLKMLKKLQQEKSKNDYFFSAFFSAETTYQEKLKKEILKLLAGAKGHIENAKGENVYQLNIDLCLWG